MSLPIVKKVLVLLADGFEEIEAVTVIDILRRAPCRVTLASWDGNLVCGSRRIRILPDTSWDAAMSETYDGLFLPGGILGVQRLMEDRSIKELIQQMNDEGKMIAAICAAPLLLKSAGILKGRTITSYPTLRENFGEANYRDEEVVVDGNLITSQAPGTAMALALELVRRLGFDRKAEEIASLALYTPLQSQFQS